ncbi:MAG: type II secretion system protein [Planctomycetota bacterium]|nr:MAG: type II secretion system protein [Planctomycetota bacterium]
MVSQQNRSNGAFTLTELLVVVGILSLLFGVGIWALLRQKKGRQLQAAEGALVHMIRLAQNTARQEGGFGAIYIHPEKRTISVAASKTIAYWSFEKNDLLPSSEEEAQLRAGGEEEIWGRASNVRLAPGYLGSALELSKPQAKVQIPPRPSFSPSHGIVINFWIKIYPSSKMTWLSIVEKDQSYALKVSPLAQFQINLWGKDSNQQSVRYQAQTYPGVFEPYTWAKVHFQFYRGKAELSIDEIPRHLLPNTQANENFSERPPQILNTSTTPLVIGNSAEEFSVFLDQLQLQAVLESDQYRLPSNVSLRIRGAAALAERSSEGETSPVAIYFDNRGGLEKRYHLGGVQIFFIPLSKGREKGEKRRIFTVQRSPSAAEAAADPPGVRCIAVLPSGLILSGEKAQSIQPKTWKEHKDTRKVR